ncbi:MAG: heavy-metal-associated domain-containing protein [Anaerobutyricum soehngenii]
MERRQLYIDGMTCINCQKRIENCLRKRVEIKEAEVSYETGTAEILYDANKITLQEIIRIINGLGYDANKLSQILKDISITGSAGADYNFYENFPYSILEY